MRRVLPTPALLVLLVACGGDAASGGEPVPDRGRDTDRRDTGNRDASDAADGRDSGGGGPDLSPADGAGATDVTPIDFGGLDFTPVDARPDLDPACDGDSDGHASRACGGDDCNDANRDVYGGAPEECDFDDNDCDGTVNNGISCEFYAHTSNQLYLVDPFLQQVSFVTNVPSGLFDFDTHPDGTLYGVVDGGSIYRFDSGAGRWVELAGVGDLGFNPNGFAIDSRGTAYITSGTSLYTIDLSTGATTRVGDTGYTSSGDCVVNKDDSIYMSAAPALFGNDTLVQLDGLDARATPIGDIGHSGVYGLTAAWGFLFGADSAGNILRIDLSTGRGTVVSTFRSQIWYGAASSPGR